MLTCFIICQTLKLSELLTVWESTKVFVLWLFLSSVYKNNLLFCMMPELQNDSYFIFFFHFCGYFFLTLVKRPASEMTSSSRSSQLHQRMRSSSLSQAPQKAESPVKLKIKHQQRNKDLYHSVSLILCLNQKKIQFWCVLTDPQSSLSHLFLNLFLFFNSWV